MYNSILWKLLDFKGYIIHYDPAKTILAVTVPIYFISVLVKRVFQQSLLRIDEKQLQSCLKNWVKL